MKMIKEIPTIINVIILTGFQNVKEINKYIKNGITDFFINPIYDKHLFAQTLENNIYKISRWEETIFESKNGAK